MLNVRYFIIYRSKRAATKMMMIMMVMIMMIAVGYSYSSPWHYFRWWRNARKRRITRSQASSGRLKNPSDTTWLAMLTGARNVIPLAEHRRAEDRGARSTQTEKEWKLREHGKTTTIYTKTKRKTLQNKKTTFRKNKKSIRKVEVKKL